MPHTLLLADDSVTIQRVIQLTFADEDVQVMAVSDGDHAIALVEAHKPDIVLADVGMPGKNGYEVSRYIKHSPRLAHIPVVLLTGAFEPLDQVKAAEAGCDGVLVKPFEPQLVISRVRELLGRSPNAPAAFAADVALSPAPPAQEVTHRSSESALEAAGDALTASDYFDQLDAAFANLTRPEIADLPLSYESPEVEVQPAVPTSLTSRQSQATSRQLQSHESPGEATEPASAPPPPTSVPKQLLKPVFPQLADAFAALLEAESQTARREAAVWPGLLAQPAAITDELVEQVAQRVLDRLSDRVVRETVADHVSTVAERLVREEIERIKASIK